MSVERVGPDETALLFEVMEHAQALALRKARVADEHQPRKRGSIRLAVFYATIMKILTSRRLGPALAMLALVLFALLPLAFMWNPGSGVADWWGIPAVGGFASAVLWGRGCSGRPLMASALAGTSTALLAWGEIATMVALRYTLNGGYGWWNEDMVGSAILIAPPLAAGSAVVSFLMARPRRV
jgi:hypothetical protein